MQGKMKNVLKTKYSEQNYKNAKRNECKSYKIFWKEFDLGL
jgi:hypothetical protein